MLVAWDSNADGQLELKDFRGMLVAFSPNGNMQESFAALDTERTGNVAASSLLAMLRAIRYDEDSASQAMGEYWYEAAIADQFTAAVLNIEEFRDVVVKSLSLQVSLAILCHFGVLWVIAQDSKYSSDVRYHEVAKLLQDEASAQRQANGRGSGHGVQIRERVRCSKLCPRVFRRLMEPAPCPVGEHNHIFPLHKMTPWPQGIQFLHKCRTGVLQYVVVQCFCSILSFVMEHWFHHFYAEGSFSPLHGYFYIATAKSISQCWALYCLLYFEHSCDSLLKPIKPMPKFWSIKLVVLATFWQSVAIAMLTSSHTLPWRGIYERCYIPRLTDTPTRNPPNLCHPWCQQGPELNWIEHGVTTLCTSSFWQTVNASSGYANETFCDPAQLLCGCPDPRRPESILPGRSDCSCVPENSYCLST